MSALTETASKSETSTSTFKGVIVEWNDAKGFGFVDDGHQRVFAHIRSFTERPRTPKPGDKVSYSLGKDRQGRVCAEHLRIEFTGLPLRGVHFAILTGLLVAPGVAIARLIGGESAWFSAGWIVTASLVTYVLYWWDKRRAQRGEWRVPENVLHFWEFIGGWPGGFLAQRRLRHKSAKLRYLTAFWFIVVIHHYIAVDALLGWRLFHSARVWIASSL